MTLLILTLLWLAAGTVGLWAWTLCWIRAQHRLDALMRSGRNGVLRDIGLWSLRTNQLGVVICVLILLVLVNALAVPAGEARVIIGRSLVIGIAVAVAVQGVWRNHTDIGIDRAIQRMTPTVVADEIREGE